MLDLSSMLGDRFSSFEPGQFMQNMQQGGQQERWQGFGSMMGGQGGIRDLLQNRGQDWRTRFRDRFGGMKRHNDPTPPQLMDQQPQEQAPMQQGDPYGNPFTPTPVALGSMLDRRPIY